VDSDELRSKGASEGALMLRWPELAADPQRVHPVHYGNVAAQLPQLFIDDLDVIDDQAVALRLVHFVDKLRPGGAATCRLTRTSC
jgi:predicted ATPase